jgi:signal transduction histidine kinase/HPt (histidine-containing phosphotransfer) domain-containing protein/ActR/RegA family two-component response regulator
MTDPSSKLRFRAVSVELTADLDDRHVDMLITANDGTLIAIEYENDSVLGVMRHIEKIADDKPLIVSKAAEPEQDISAAGFIQHAASDMTGQARAERENVESRRIFDDLFDNSDAGVIDYDFSILFKVVQGLKKDGVRNLRSYFAESDERRERLAGSVRVNNANAAALRMLGVTSLEELVGQSTNIVDIAEAMLQGETRIRRSEYLVAGDTPIPIVYSLRVPKTQEEALRVPIVIMDLSDVKLAEAARQATVAKSQFLSSMSHEIRTPLNGLIGNLELLALTNLDNDQFELIDDADKAAKSLLALIGNILDFSKIEAGKLTTEFGDLNPVGLMEEAVDVLQSRARQKKIFIAACIGPDVPSLVRGDAMRVRQILLNLIGNAVKFTDEGGVQVTLAVSSWNKEECELRFDIHDSGRGFDQILADRLFHPFIQGQADDDGQEGTGLGLSICKSLIEAFGGAIGCESTPGFGASFWFTLPVTILTRAPPVVRPDLSGTTVMVIGGASGAAKSLEDYFTSRGALVVTKEHRISRAFAQEQSDDTEPAVDIAVIVANGDGGDWSQKTRHLRDLHIVPLLYGIDQSARTRLRQGFATVIPPDACDTHLDRNIRLLMGHAQARDRLAAQQAAVMSAFGPNLRGKNILVLEDRLVNQTVIQKQLKNLGIDCTLAANGVKGIEILDRQRFDLILCDCSMPVMNGYEFTRHLRQREKTDGGGVHIPVIALTANAFREDVDKCREAGMDDFISKPVTLDRLAAMLVRWLSVPEPKLAVDLSPPDATMIDMPALVEILGTNDPETLNMILAQFLTIAGSSLAEVKIAMSNGDPDGIKAAAHSAKGEAHSAAAIELGGLYAELERTAKNGDRSVPQGLLDRAAVEVGRIENFIHARLKADHHDQL